MGIGGEDLGNAILELASLLHKGTDHLQQFLRDMLVFNPYVALRAWTGTPALHLKSDEERTIRLQPGNGASDAAFKTPLCLAKILATLKSADYADACNIVLKTSR